MQAVGEKKRFQCLGVFWIGFAQRCLDVSRELPLLVHGQQVSLQISMSNNNREENWVMVQENCKYGGPRHTPHVQHPTRTTHRNYNTACGNPSTQ